MKRILGISAFYHDSAATVTEGGRIVAAAQEERFTRKKHDSSFPAHACRFCLDYSGFSVDELDAVVFYDKPLLKFERLLETYYGFAPAGVGSFITAMPVWLREKLFLKRMIREELSKIGRYDPAVLPLLFPEHHLSHAASAFYPSSFEEAAILTVDGVGEWATASLCHGRGNGISLLRELHFPHSLGLLYSAFTYFLGFRVNSGEYKLMGLAPYGIPGSLRTVRFRRLIESEIVRICEDGSLWMNPAYFRYATGLRMVHEKRWERLFGFPRRLPESELTQEVCDLALAIQEVTTGIMLKMAREARRLTGSPNLCLAGGVALNCVANGRLLREKIFDRIFIQPAAGDAGGSLGAALAAHYLWFGEPRRMGDPGFSMDGACWGPDFGDKEIQSMVRKFQAVCRPFERFDELAAETASLLDRGMVVGWFQGRMEFGPRALGNRSILGDPRNADMQRKLNLKIKYRESFRPFAPAVLEEDCAQWFDLDTPSPYMLLVAGVKEALRYPLSQDYHELPLRERLYTLRSTLPAITHIDFSARIQTVHRDTHPRFWTLIRKFREKTGCGVLVNTSFNVRGEPIVCSPTDAYRCFMRTEMDYLVINNCLFDKRMQPPWPEDDHWQTDYVLD
ncbi:MAG: carbamoyltransferase [Bacteroidales bacterium]|nr:carbamoyltransferase [Bacteroidales bacterium]